MDELLKLAKIVTNRRKKLHPLLIFKKKHISKEQLFFTKLLEGEFKTEEEAAAAICGTGPSDPQFKMLKHRLRTKLFNNLLFLDFSDNRIKVSHRYEEKCNHLLHQARVLMQLSELGLAEKNLKSSLALAREAEFTDISIYCLRNLTKLYAYASRHTAFYPAMEQLQQFTSLFVHEQEAEMHAYTARLELNKSVRARKSFLPKLIPIIDRLRELWEQTGSYNIFENYYMLNLWHKELIGDFKSIVQVTEESEEKLEQGKINQMRFDHRYNKFINVSARLRIKDYQQGLHVASEYIKAFERSSNNWFAFMENYFLLAIQSGDYHKAHILSETVANNPHFAKIKQQAQERWRLYRTYLYFVSPNEKLLKSFNYYKFINDVPEYSRDKQGFNVAILIIQFLYFLQKDDVESLLNRIESIRKYISTHLRDVFSERSRLFFKLLMLVVQENFDAKVCREKGAKIHKKLQELPPPGDAYAEVEIIPYEDLWNMVLQILKDKE
ncbi:MAG: hypothetical protein LPJ89_07350 [Hymenobacteraceae bacterium]|nr:hypothetical protein [Hymenobacteraceae bacterium]